MGRSKARAPSSRRLRVNVMLDPGLREQLRDLAISEDRNFSDQLNRILRLHFAKNGRKATPLAGSGQPATPEVEAEDAERAAAYHERKKEAKEAVASGS
jgi:hypothetical protein